MFLVDKPYISDFFKETIRHYNIPVVKTAVLDDFAELYEDSNLISEKEAIEAVKEGRNSPIYSNSENAIAWFSRNVPFSDIPGKIEIFKNKAKFREAIKPLYPEFFFQEVDVKEICKLDYASLPKEFIIKPTVGFFSLGVHKVSSQEQWQSTIIEIEQELEEIVKLYPKEVLQTESFIIEECIDGDEFAIDAYWDENGTAVILGILNHRFASSEDVSDRVYSTSTKIIQENINEFRQFVQKVGEITGCKKFPVHIELRRQADGTLIPIEFNPMRFGGWCSTADLTYKAFGINPYACYFSQSKPQWDLAMMEREDKIFSLVILDNSTGYSANEIASFDYDLLLTDFVNPLELRKIDYNEHPVFAFLLTETPVEETAELDSILISDLKKYVSLK
ncbi:MAG: ATP-grasp domain-containing protein [Desulfotalea sp.]